ncbi:MAG: hypothetical protein R3B72_13470 [Polyangiaceae bacterium]
MSAEEPDSRPTRGGGVEVVVDDTDQKPGSWSEQLLAYLRLVIPALTDQAQVAQALLDESDLCRELGLHAEACAAAGRAHRLQPMELRFARGHRLAALGAGVPKEEVLALETEGQRLGDPAAQSIVQVERAMLLERELENPRAALFALRRAVDLDPTNLLALMRLEHEADRSGDRRRAADLAVLQAAAVEEDDALRAEHLARAARHQHAAGDTDQAMSSALEALELSPASTTASFEAERLAVVTDASEVLLRLRRSQIEQGVVPAAAGWFDIGAIARRRGDLELAMDALLTASTLGGTPEEGRGCKVEVATILREIGRGGEARAMLASLAEEASPSSERSGLRRRLSLFGRGHDPAEAARAMKETLASSAPDPLVLEAGVRVLSPVSSGGGDQRELLLEAYRVLSDCATTAAHCAHALRCRGELLLAHPETVAEGVAVLHEACRAVPGHHSAFRLLDAALRERQSFTELLTLYELELERCGDPSFEAWLLGRIAKLHSEHLDGREQAVEALARASRIDIGTGPPPSLLDQAELLQRLEAWGELAGVLRRLATASQDPARRASALEWLYSVERARGDEDAAMTALLEAADAAPPSHPVVVAALDALILRERYHDALSVLNLARERAPDEEMGAWLRRIAGLEEIYLGRIEEALGHLRRAFEIVDPADRPGLREEIDRLEGELDEEQTAPMEGPLVAALHAEVAGDLHEALSLYKESRDEGGQLAAVSHARLALAAGDLAWLEAEYAARTGEPSEVMHARCRSAVIAQELGRPTDAVRHLLAATSARREALSPVMLMLPLVAHVPATHYRLLSVLRHLTEDPRTQLACVRGAAYDLATVGDHLRALDMHRQVLATRPSDPASLPRVTLALANAERWVDLAETLRRAVDDTALEPRLRGLLFAHLATALEHLGERHAAVLAWTGCQAEIPDSRRALLSLARLHRELDDDEQQLVALEALAQLGPGGPHQAACLRQAARLADAGGAAHRARVALEAAVASEPRDYPSLAQLIDREILTPAATIEALTRALSQEDDDEALARVGTALAARLVAIGRLHTAHETLERVLATAPDDLRALMQLCEVHERRKRWEQASLALRKVAEHPDALADVKLEALRRLATLQVVHLQDLAGAVETSHAVAALADHRAASQYLVLEVASLAGDDATAEAALRALTAHPRLSDEQRDDAKRRLAELRGEPEVDEEAPTRRPPESTRSAPSEPPASVPQRRRSSAPAPENLTAEAEGLVDELRTMLRERPAHPPFYRALRDLFLALKAYDAAFCAEAVLVGLEAATEDERYFYAQRRRKYGGRLGGTLELEDLQALHPELGGPEAEFLSMIDRTAARVFALDRESYFGGRSDRATAEGEARVVATSLGIPEISVSLVAAQLGPTVEPGPNGAQLFLTRDVDDAAPRVQRFVAGALLARYLFGGVAPCPIRSTALPDWQLDHLIAAGFELAGVSYPSIEERATVYADMLTLVRAALHGEERAALTRAAHAVPQPSRITGAGWREGSARAAARTGLLFASDPAAAIAASRELGAMFGERGGIPKAMLDVLPYAVSGAHLAVRHRLRTQS